MGSMDAGSSASGASGMIGMGGIRRRRAIINAAGEGAIWVCDVNGPVRIGDLLVTAPLPGLAMCQVDRGAAGAGAGAGMPFLNTTVAKATCACDFSHAPVEHTELGTRFRRALIGCVYA